MSSIFKTKAVVVKKEKMSKWDVLYTVFSGEYWKFVCSKKFSNKEKELELWAVFSWEISVREKRDIHNIRNIKIKNQLNYTKLDFNSINSYLILISEINKNTMKSMIIPEIIDIVEMINLKEGLKSYTIILWRLKLKNIFWLLKIESKNLTTKKILNFIDKNKFKEIIKLSNLSKEIEENLTKLLS